MDGETGPGGGYSGPGGPYTGKRGGTHTVSWGVPGGAAAFPPLPKESGMQGVRPEKLKALEERMEALGIRDEDIIEKFIRSSGRGGQKVNKTSTCVYLKHLPTGIEVKCRESRSQALNRFLARRHLTDRIEQRLLGSDSHIEKKAHRIRKQKLRRRKRSRLRDREGR